MPLEELTGSRRGGDRERFWTGEPGRQVMGRNVAYLRTWKLAGVAWGGEGGRGKMSGNGLERWMGGQTQCLVGHTKL